MKRRIIQIVSHIDEDDDTGKPIHRLYGLASDGSLWWFDEVDGWLKACSSTVEDESDYPEIGNRR